MKIVRPEELEPVYVELAGNELVQMHGKCAVCGMRSQRLVHAASFHAWVNEHWRDDIGAWNNEFDHAFPTLSVNQRQELKYGIHEECVDRYYND